MSQNEIQEVELSIEAAREMVDRGKAALRLADNPDFKRLITTGYFRDEAARLALLLSEPTISEEIRDNINRDLIGVGAVKRYLTTIVQMGEHAASEIESAQEVLEELRAEEDAE